MLMTIDEVATYLKVSKETIYKLAQQSKIPASKIGNQWRFRKETIDIWLDESLSNNIDRSMEEDLSSKQIQETQGSCNVSKV